MALKAAVDFELASGGQIACGRPSAFSIPSLCCEIAIPRGELSVLLQLLYVWHPIQQ